MNRKRSKKHPTKQAYKFEAVSDKLPKQTPSSVLTDQIVGFSRQAFSFILTILSCTLFALVIIKGYVWMNENHPITLQFFE